MKFLSIEALDLLSSFLSSREVGDASVSGRIEAFSCKRAGEDKKLSKMLEAQYVDELASSPASMAQHLMDSSPLGPLSESSTRRLLIDLISTMNASFPDHDFSGLRPDQFTREPSLTQVMASVNKRLSPLQETHTASFLDELWQSIDQVVKVHECEVYSYVPNMEDDPFSQEPLLWSFNFFFFNKALKRILFFTAMAKSKHQHGSFGGVDGECDGSFALEDDVDDAPLSPRADGDDEDDAVAFGGGGGGRFGSQFPGGSGGRTNEPFGFFGDLDEEVAMGDQDDDEDA